MATPAEQDLVLTEADNNKERGQVFGILRLQEDKSAAVEKANSPAMKSGDGRWQAPIFALARKASETFSGGIHVLPRVTEPKTSPLSEEWGAKGRLWITLKPVAEVGFSCSNAEPTCMASRFNIQLWLKTNSVLFLVLILNYY